MLLRYCEERHNIYLNHGYSNSILQVMSDHYSHKRNSKSSIEKILSILLNYKLKRIKTINSLKQKNWYFLPDKGNKNLFDLFLKKYNLKMQSRLFEQNKLPDIVIKLRGEFYICELKTINGSGGGQNKQIVELINFIRYSEVEKKVHYLAFLDGDYSSLLFTSNVPKIINQRDDISKLLQKNEQNYFVNTAGFKKLLNDIYFS